MKLSKTVFVLFIAVFISVISLASTSFAGGGDVGGHGGGGPTHFGQGGNGRSLVVCGGDGGGPRIANQV